MFIVCHVCLWLLMVVYCDVSLFAVVMLFIVVFTVSSISMSDFLVLAIVCNHFAIRHERHNIVSSSITPKLV